MNLLNYVRCSISSKLHVRLYVDKCVHHLCRMVGHLWPMLVISVITMLLRFYYTMVPV